MIIPYKWKNPTIHKTAFVAENATIIGDTLIEEDASIFFGAVLRGDIQSIRIGKRSNIQDNAVIHVSSNAKVDVGENVTVGHAAILHGCTIENNVIIGMGSTILDHAIIPKNSIVGANSLVTSNKTFKEGTLILGAPAKVVRKLTKEEILSIQHSADKYVEVMGNFTS